MAAKRLKKELKAFLKDPPPHLMASPLESNILHVHYVILGPEDSPYEGGFYHGVILFPSEYPFKPPRIKMFTPSGRFETNTAICLSMSDFHPETWNPTWSLSTILLGLLSFMLEPVSPESTVPVGSLVTSDHTKRELAAKSLAFNVKDRNFVALFPHLVDLLDDDDDDDGDGDGDGDVDVDVGDGAASGSGAGAGSATAAAPPEPSAGAGAPPTATDASGGSGVTGTAAGADATDSHGGGTS